MHKNKSVRLRANGVVTQVLAGASLTDALSRGESGLDKRDCSFLRQLCYGSIRHYYILEFYLNALLSKPIKTKDIVVKVVLLLGLYELFYLRTPAHAVVSESIKIVNCNYRWAKGLVNGILRNAIRQKEVLIDKLSQQPEYVCFSYPIWLFEKIKKQRPNNYQEILFCSNEQGPMTLRINSSRINRDDYFASLKQKKISAKLCQYSSDGITLLNAVDVATLPGFSEGWVSVQDEAAQLAGLLLTCESGNRVLDACAAPGGKACHLLEKTPDIDLDVLDSSLKRLERVSENFQRLGVCGKILCGDASQPSQWWNGELYDRILLDAPCSATGVIRRHPDIKLLRTPDDIQAQTLLQKKILRALWPLLREGGVLLYATCSILPEENCEQVETFLSENNDAILQSVDLTIGANTPFGIQMMPKFGGYDGFFYSLIMKSFSI